VKGGGHGDYRLLVLAPASVQEAVEMVMAAFPLAEKYLNPVMILGDGLIGQMMERSSSPTISRAPRATRTSGPPTGSTRARARGATWSGRSTWSRRS